MFGREIIMKNNDRISSSIIVVAIEPLKTDLNVIKILLSIRAHVDKYTVLMSFTTNSKDRRKDNE